MKINWKYATLGLCALMVSTGAMAQRAGWLTPFLMERAKVTWTARSTAITNVINQLQQDRDVEAFARNYKEACRGLLSEQMSGGFPVWAVTSQGSACQVGDYLYTKLITHGRTNIRYCLALNGAINALERGKNSNEGPHMQPQLDEFLTALQSLKGSEIRREGGIVRTENDILFVRDRTLKCN